MTDRRRCAIYTRKSTDEGLEQGFNSLHAQREACEAYIKSQAHEGWVTLRTEYDDGGFSGGSMERPALQRLLADIGNGRIDTVIVYKVDRLTRSLTDFARIVETFDAQGIAFVSVTQQFNTTTSMGRLTLNVLLSFAQFEREVTAERIRDKIAASKKKGMWMGGLVPLGYDVRDRELIINTDEAETVRTLFRLYGELGTVRQLKEAADRLGLAAKQRLQCSGRMTGGGSFSRGHLYRLLSNPLYVGEIAHKGAIYPGRHEAIIGRETFDAVQGQLSGNATDRRSAVNTKAPSLLTGLIYDETGDRLCPTHANKRGRRYRYYISKRLMHPNSPGTQDGAGADGWRLPARELETTVLDAINGFLKDELRIVGALELSGIQPDRLRRILGRFRTAADVLKGGPHDRRRRLLSALLHRVTLAANAMRIEIKRSGLANLLAEPGTPPAVHPEGHFNLILPIQLRRRGIEAKLVIHAPSCRSSSPDAKLIQLLADAQRWIDDLAQGRAVSVRDLARQANRDPGEISRTLPLAFLAPDIVETILAGRQPVGLTPHQLKRIGMLPHRWNDQRRLLGFPA
jgi:DNA invertase Pin-like site-specific DNA recombinase